MMIIGVTLVCLDGCVVQKQPMGISYINQSKDAILKIEIPSMSASSRRLRIGLKFMDKMSREGQETEKTAILWFPTVDVHLNKWSLVYFGKSVYEGVSEPKEFERLLTVGKIANCLAAGAKINDISNREAVLSIKLYVVGESGSPYRYYESSSLTIEESLQKEIVLECRGF